MLIDAYRVWTGGDVAAATLLGQDLTRGVTLNEGEASYSAENATLAVAELFGLDAGQTDEVRGRLK